MNRLLQPRMACRVLWAGILFTIDSVWAQDNKPVIVITPQEVCDYCDTFVDAGFDLTGEGLYLAARGTNKDGDTYPYMSFWDITRTDQTRATAILAERSPVIDSKDFAINLDPTGRLVGIAGANLKLWNARVDNGTLPYLATLAKTARQIHSFAFSQKGDKIAAGLDENGSFFSVWDTYRFNGSDPLPVAKGSTGDRVMSIQFHATKPYLLAGRRHIELWDYSQITNGVPKELADLSYCGDSSAIMFDSDRERIVASTTSGCAAVWDLNNVMNGSKDPIITLNHGGNVVSISIDPTGRYILTASWNQTAKLWDTAQLENKVPLLLATMKHQCEVKQALFAPDKNRILTSSNCEVKYWNTQEVKDDGQATLLNTFNTDGSYNKIQLDPAGIWLLSVSNTLTQLWDIAALEPDQE